MMRKILFTGTLLLATQCVFAETNAELINKIKTLKPLDMQGVTVKEVKDIGGLYLVNLQVKDRMGARLQQASVSKDLKHVTIGTTYDSKDGIALGFNDLAKVVKDAAFTLGNKGKGGEFFIITDPDCPACKGFEKALHDKNLLAHTQLHVLFYPLDRLHPDARKKCEYILSQPAEKREAVYNAIHAGDGKWMEYQVNQEAKADLMAMTALADELQITGTPTIFDMNGNHVGNDVFMKYLEALNANYDKLNKGDEK